MQMNSNALDHKSTGLVNWLVFMLVRSSLQIAVFWKRWHQLWVTCCKDRITRDRLHAISFSAKIQHIPITFDYEIEFICYNERLKIIIKFILGYVSQITLDW